MSNAPPAKLYKYLPSRYVRDVLGGKLLFRNLSYFRKLECNKRGDPLEGHHRDNPDNDVKLEIIRSGRKFVGDFSFLNSTDSDLIFVYCLSEKLDNPLFDEFECDCCIEITDVGEFVRRVRIAIRRLVLVHKAGLLSRSVTYYAPNKSAEINIEDPKELVFAKDEIFLDQNEYRLVFGKGKAFSIKQSIVINKLYDVREEAMKGISEEKMVRIGKINDIANVRYANK